MSLLRKKNKSVKRSVSYETRLETWNDDLSATGCIGQLRKEESEYNIITVAWTGTICTNPPMCYISVRPERYSHEIIKRTWSSLSI